MELFKELFFSCQEYLERDLNYCAVTILISLIAGMIFLVFRASSTNNKEIENECNKEDFFEEPAIKTDPQKAFCQTVRFTMRLRRKMRAFKEKKEKQKN